MFLVIYFIHNSYQFGNTNTSQVISGIITIKAKVYLNISFISLSLSISSPAKPNKMAPKGEKGEISVTEAEKAKATKNSVLSNAAVSINGPVMGIKNP